ncbi:hypothetical protein DFP72DRAFT_1039419 [Ephemerocybe angulata]|uniref:Secreted protein n=1 Tax=Ephemerocybe angulata TaxID=980116 RepID=A0A8H6IH66_9AGAR|nr:hypothetical protein DFP72DRAFT_1039419 [Tulosesus angulatus]
MLPSSVLCSLILAGSYIQKASAHPLPLDGVVARDDIDPAEFYAGVAGGYNGYSPCRTNVWWRLQSRNVQYAEQGQPAGQEQPTEKEDHAKEDRHARKEEHTEEDKHTEEERHVEEEKRPEEEKHQNCTEPQVFDPEIYSSGSQTSEKNRGEGEGSLVNFSLDTFALRASSPLP